LGVVVRRLSLVVFAAVAALSTLASVRADESFGSFLVVDKFSEAIFLNGPITADTPLDFRRAMRERPNATTIFLNSEGGLVQSALLIAQDVNRAEMKTYVPEGRVCNSACSFIFLAGQQRTLHGTLGVHQPSADKQDNSAMLTTIAYVVEVLEPFDTPSEVIDTMLRTEPADLHVFDPTDWQRMEMARVNQAMDKAVPTKPGLTAINENESGVRTDALMMSVPVERLALYNGLDFYGADIGSGHMENFAECSRACLGDRQCSAFTFNADPKIKTGPNCFLKSGYGRLEAYDYALSGIRLDTDTINAPTFSFDAIDPLVDLEKGERLTGASGMSMRVGSLGECRTTCIEEDSCEAFTYRSSNKQCTLQTSVGRRVSANGYYSGIKRSLTFTAEILPID
jgi:hypothetical protein